MKYIILLLFSLLVIGCGKKSSSEGSDSAAESAEPSADAVKPVPTESPGKEPSPSSLSDADIERLLKEAVDSESLPERDGLIYHDDKPYSGWGKEMYDSGQAFRLGEVKEGKPDGLMIEWHQNGQKRAEGTFKDGKQDGPFKAWYENGQKMFEGTYKDGNQVDLSTGWHENGQKAGEGTLKDGRPHGLVKVWHENGQKLGELKYKDGEEVSGKYWNSKGEEVDTEEEAFK